MRKRVVLILFLNSIDLYVAEGDFFDGDFMGDAQQPLFDSRSRREMRERLQRNIEVRKREQENKQKRMANVHFNLPSKKESVSFENHSFIDETIRPVVTELLDDAVFKGEVSSEQRSIIQRVIYEQKELFKLNRLSRWLIRRFFKNLFRMIIGTIRARKKYDQALSAFDLEVYAKKNFDEEFAREFKTRKKDILHFNVKRIEERLKRKEHNL
ncbi:hypothetical protein HYV11_01940 [Candidatus Dependentiae bacterium]|nr:hypothetical protein [Candidatus Dependentiae bacterium]